MKEPVELWIEHPDIDKLEVSSFGRVRSVKGHYYKSNRINGGYLQVYFSINGKQINKLVHRLVAETFIPNPNNMPEVNHKDGNRSNNNAINLEWCSKSYNQKYRNKFGISSTEVLGHPLFAIDLKTLEVSRFRSQREAGRALGVSSGNINEVIKGKLNQTHGYWFTNADEKAENLIKKKLYDVKMMG